MSRRSGIGMVLHETIDRPRLASWSEEAAAGGSDDLENLAPRSRSVSTSCAEGHRNDLDIEEPVEPDVKLLGVGHRTGRRPTIFTIAENYEFDDEEFQRKLSSCLSTYSSNSSLESDTGESWRSRALRRVSIIPKAMGLQPWVTSGGHTSSQSRAKKKRKYEDIKNLINAGKLNEAKGAVRDGDWDFGDDIRTRLWPFLASIHDTKHTGGDYWELVKEIFGHQRNETPTSSVLLPGPCSQESAVYYNLDETGISYCNRICSVLIYSYPDITYCPWLCPITALFLHYVEEEKAYACVGNLLKATNKVFMTQTRLQTDASAMVALALTKKFSKSTYSTLVQMLSSEETIESVFDSWSDWIFRDLPIPHLVRVIDCFLMEGIKVFYRVIIGILHHFGKTETSAESLKSSISEHCKCIQLNPSRLLKKAFSIRNFRSAEIKSVTVKTTFDMKTAKIPRTGSTDSVPQNKGPLDISCNSRTVNVKELYGIWQWLPVRISMHEPQLIYTTDEDGCSLSTFFNKVEQYEPVLMILKATTGEVFGAYCSTAWAVRNEKDQRGERQRYFGTGESFLFGLQPQMIKYPWVGIKGRGEVEHAAELFMHADNNMFAVGGGSGTGIQVDADLRFGKSERCLTFENEPLVSGGDFEVQVLECFAFSMV